jgi:hypothetical protein
MSNLLAEYLRGELDGDGDKCVKDVPDELPILSRGGKSS